MPGQALRLGPFTGLNNVSDPTAVADSELTECINFERDLDGSLVCRPPIKDTTNMSGTWTERIVMLGVGVFPTGNYLIGSNVNGTFYYQGGAWVLINAYQAAAFVQYDNELIFLGVPGSVQALAYWSPTVPFALVVDAELTAMMGAQQGGGNLVIYKERLFIVPGEFKTTNTSRLIFSDVKSGVGGPKTFAANTQFIDVRPGDGQRLIDIAVYDDNLILFKNDSTHILAYSTDPLLGDKQVINSVIGATGRRCVVQYKNATYVFHEGNVYEMINYDFNQINDKVDFIYDAFTPPTTTRVEAVFLCIFGDRLFVNYYNSVYLYNFKTRTWSTWQSRNPELHNFGPLVAMPSNVATSVNTEYYAGSNLLGSEFVFIMKDGFSTTDRESFNSIDYPIDCYAKTKNFDLANSYKFKKLNYWGADVVASSSVLGTANPISVGFQTTWGALFGGTTTWAHLGTWAAPVTSSVINDTVADIGVTSGRRFVRFSKALRYRQINFRLHMTCTGSSIDSPCKLFSITMFTSTKQTVNRDSN